MEEMHDQFRDDEAAEFHELQKELEATAKNCRILQFKLRKLERRNEQAEADRQRVRLQTNRVNTKFNQGDKIMVTSPSNGQIPLLSLTTLWPRILYIWQYWHQ